MAAEHAANMTCICPYFPGPEPPQPNPGRGRSVGSFTTSAISAARCHAGSDQRAMTKMTKAELKLSRLWLEAWRHPTEALSRVNAIHEAMGASDFFGQGGTTFLRDAWAAATFAAARGAPEMRLVADTWPDAEICWPAVSGRIVTEPIDIVEADLPDRRRDDEYRQWDAEGGGARQDPVEHWIARAEHIPAALASAVDRKVAKRYAGQASLLILLISTAAETADGRSGVGTCCKVPFLAIFA